jgi:RNA polymerase sigma factor (sigma-70 family)
VRAEETSQERSCHRSDHVNLPPFQALLEEHRTDVYRFCLASAGRSDADDCVQETWIAALRAYPTLRRAENLRAWLLRIAQNKAIDLHRARARRAVPVAAVPEQTAAPAAEPELDGESDLWAAVRSLPPKQRTAVFCRTVLGMPYDELSVLLECSEDAARRNAFEGLNKLREEWTR